MLSDLIVAQASSDTEVVGNLLLSAFAAEDGDEILSVVE